MPSVEIISMVENFYKEADIKDAKDLIWNKIGDTLVRRKGQHRVQSEIQDILDAFQKAESTEKVLPKFATGFELVTEALTTLRNDIGDVKREIGSFERLKQEMASLRKDVQNLKKPSNQMTQTYAGQVQSGLNCPFESQPSSGAIRKAPGGRPAPRTTIPNGENGRRSSQAMILNEPRASDVRADGENNASNRVPRNEYDWTVYRSRRRRNYVVGSKSGEHGGFEGAPRFGELYIGGCGQSVTEDMIKTYCKDKIDVTLLELETLLTKSTEFRSFKAKLSLDQRDKCLNGDLWPKGVIVRKFYRGRNDSKRVETNQNGPNG